MTEPFLRVSSRGEPHMEDGYVFGLHVLRSGWACYVVSLVLCRRVFAVCVNLGAWRLIARMP